MSIYTQPPTSTPEEIAWISFNGYLVQVACTTVVVWDHISTFDLEVELIWKKKWSLVQLLYFINRYVGDFSFLYAITLTLVVPNASWRAQCPNLGKVQTWFSIITLTSMQGIMVQRIISMHKHERAVLYSLLAAFVVELVAAIILGATSAVMIGSIPLPLSSSLRVCIPINWPTWTPALWFLLMIFDLLIFIMAVREAIRYWKESRKRVRSSEASDILAGTGWSHQHSLLKILLRDSILFPFLGLMFCMFNSLAWYKLPFGALQYTATIAASSSPILGCRLILNLRDAYYRPFADEIRMTTKPVGGSPAYSPHCDGFEMPETAIHPNQSLISINSRELQA